MTTSTVESLKSTIERAPLRADAQRALVLLDDMAAYRVRGSDRLEFLSRQLTCDVSALSPERSVHGAWLSAKGRVQALLRLVLHGDELVLGTAAGAAEATLRRLSMFVLRADVRFDPAPDLAWVGLGLPRAPHAPVPNAPQTLDAVADWDGLALLRVSTAPDRFIALGRADALAARLGELIEAGFARMPRSLWRRHDIESGQPSLEAANVDCFVPQMLNLDRTGAVSFSKGCYPGQEIVARTQHLGRIKRRMFIARAAAAPDRLEPGAAVTVDGAEAGTPGRIVCSAPDGDDGSVLLAVLPLDAVSAGARFTVDGVTLRDLRAPDYDGPARRA